LAAGVRAVRGDFPAGSAVRVLGPGEVILGVGLCNYSSSELESVKGLHSDQIAARLGGKDLAEVIHRDNLVVFDLGEEEEVACLLNT
jgi:glutamate 5-kinase